MSNDRSKPVIGANVKCLIETLSTPISVELLINNKGKLVDFCVISENQDFTASFISLLESGISKEFINFFDVDRAKDYDSSKFFLLYWWQLLDEVKFFVNPSLSDCVSNQEQTLCRCFNISFDDVATAITNGANDLLAVTNVTKAGAGCGSCHKQINELLSSEVGEAKAVQAEIKEAKIARIKRGRIEGLWPAAFLLEKIYPLVDQFNNDFEKSAEVVGLIEHNLYIKSQDKIEPLEHYLNNTSSEIILFYV